VAAFFGFIGRPFHGQTCLADAKHRCSESGLCALPTDVKFAFGSAMGQAENMFAILGLGFVLGLQHALEADHIAAVSSIAARRSEIGDIVRHGLTWGLGHTLTLFVFAGAAIVLGQAIPKHLAQPIETAVGIMLIGLGSHVLWWLWRDRVHFHRHSHGDGTVHIHAHSHAGETTAHARAPHSHSHGFRWRTLLVGLMHGMAGSATSRCSGSAR